MKNNPLAIICILFCLGIWTAAFVHIPLFLVYAGVLLFLLLALISLKKALLFSLTIAAAIFCAGILHLENARTHPPSHILNFISDSPQKVYIRGKVVSSPEVSRTFYHGKKTAFIYQADDLKIGERWQIVEGLVKATLYGEREVGYGDKLVLQGSLERPAGLRNPGGFDYRAYLANHNIFGLLKVKEKDAFLSMGDTLLRPSGFGGQASPIRLGNGPRPALRSFSVGGLGWETVLRFKQKMHRIIYQHLEAPQAALLSAILLGERAALSQDTKDLFVNTGTIHILAISGLHVGLISLILIALFRFLRLRRKAVFILTIFLLISYALLSGARPSVVRATVMAVIVLFGFLINREAKIYNSLGLAALLILIVRPHYLFDAGFQLSFLSVISIVYFAPKIEKFFALTHRGFWFYLVRAFSVSLAAWVGIAPLTGYYFNIVSPIAILANLVVIPLLFLAVSTGIVFLIFASFWVGLGAVLAETCALSLLGLTKAAWLFSKIPLGFFHCPKPEMLFFLAYYGLLLLLFNYRRLKLSSAKLAIILSLAANVFVWKPHLLEVPSKQLNVTFLDVGHGDAIFIEFPEGKTMLIDAGQGGKNNAGRWVVLPFLWNKGIDEIDAVVLSHPDNDHVGGLASVLEGVKVNYVFDNGMPCDSIAYHSYKEAVKNRVSYYSHIRSMEEIIGFPQVKLFVLHPPEGFLAPGLADTNNNSLILKLIYRDVSFLFCGDIQKQGIEQILSYSPMLKSTVIKIPHHGSDEGRIERRLFRAVSAQLAVISAGSRDTRFKFAAPAVIGRLRKLSTRVYTTGQTGAVTISTDGRNVRVSTMVE